MSTNKSHINKYDFKRYRLNQMTDRERNAFEKELQKNPFETEALEGFENFQKMDFQNDLNELEEKIAGKKHNRNIYYIAVAASILVLIFSGIIWKNINKQLPTSTLTENRVEVEQKERQEVDIEIHKKIDKKEFAKTSRQKEIKRSVPKKEDVSVNEKKIVESAAPPHEQPVVMDMAAVEEELETDDAFVKKTDKKNKPTLNKQSNIIYGQVISAEDSMPIPGAYIIEKGTNNETISDIDGQFKLQLENKNNSVVANFIGMEQEEKQLAADSTNIIALSSEQLALEEVVVTGYGVQRKSITTGSSQTIPPMNIDEETQNISPAKPVCGYKKYKVYIRKKAILPDQYSKKRIVVLVQIELDPNGTITSVNNLNNARKELFDKAKKIVLSGPGWEPKKMNNQNESSKVVLRIVFKKQ